MSENKTGKYLKYALGEILLVMIGILLALQVNNWNEERKKEVIELQFLNRLVTDLVSDTIYLNRRIKDSETEINNYQQYVKKAYKEQKSIDEFKELVGLLFFNSEHFVYQNSTYLELINGGQVSIFKNQQIKNNIIALYKDYSVKEAHIREFNEYSSDYLKKTELTVVKYLGFLNNSFENNNPEFFHKAEWEFINDRSSYKFRILEEISITYAKKHSTFKNYFVEMKAQAIQLINDINDELIRRDND